MDGLPAGAEVKADGFFKANGSVAADRFYGDAAKDGHVYRDLLWPLEALAPRERFIFVEYHYYRTHMKVLAKNLKLSLGGTYELLYRAEEKVAGAQAAKAPNP